MPLSVAARPPPSRGGSLPEEKGKHQLHRWTTAVEKPREFHAGELEVPVWMLALAEVESE